MDIFQPYPQSLIYLKKYLSEKEYNLEDSIIVLQKSISIFKNMDNLLFMLREIDEGNMFFEYSDEFRIDLINFVSTLIARININFDIEYDELNFSIDFNHYFRDSDYLLIANLINSYINSYENTNIAEKSDSVYSELRYLREVRNLLIENAIHRSIPNSEDTRLQFWFDDISNLYSYDIYDQKDRSEIEQNLYKYSLRAFFSEHNGDYFYLGYCFENGIGTSLDLDTACHCYSLHMQNKSSKDNLAYSRQATLYFKSGDYTKGISILEKGSKLSLIDCMFHLAMVLYDGEVVLKDQLRAMDLYYEISKTESTNMYYRKTIQLAKEKLDKLTTAYSSDRMRRDSSYFEETLYFLNKLADRLNEREFHSNEDSFQRYSSQNKIMNYSPSTMNFLTNKITIAKFSKYKSKFDNELNAIFGGKFDKLNEKSKEMIFNSMILYSEIRNNLELIDYTPVVMNLFKALEIELRINFYENYINFLQSNHRKNGKYTISSKCLYGESGKYKNQFHDFTLGALKYIIFNCESCTEYNFNNSGFKLYIEEDYISPISKLENRVNWSYFKDLVSCVEHVKDSYRNPSMHSQHLSQAEAIDCYELILSKSGLLRKIIDIKK